ncbi:hypothetical protein [Cupriavidus sp. AU9028]|uniref:hypothetical protein n=1 Tax=Cupriavidus sp. AU9028 TaxID=2871157 RepID=UPI001C961E04|nr:hypothetical protein [Cupriavidus sp. AU9028]MBY4898796.1 hypothetical protein [Cupriavidus sp. AU9028]
MYHYITPALLAHLFADTPKKDAADAAHAAITQPMTAGETGIEVIGIALGLLRFVVFFASALVYAGGNRQWVQETADGWANGFTPAASGRLVKFMRAEADGETMFDARYWPLPNPNMVWRFADLLGRALAVHAGAFPDVPQYFYLPQTGQLERLYARVGKRFESGSYGVTFRCVIRPAQQTGGFHGYERT